MSIIPSRLFLFRFLAVIFTDRVPEFAVRMADVGQISAVGHKAITNTK